MKLCKNEENKEMDEKSGLRPVSLGSVPIYSKLTKPITKTNTFLRGNRVNYKEQKQISINKIKRAY